MTDHIVRATAAQEHIRAFAVDSTETVAKARAIHMTYPVVEGPSDSRIPTL